MFERYNAPYTEEMKPFVDAMLHKRVLVKLHEEQVVSWDHRKLGRGPTVLVEAEHPEQRSLR